MPIFHGAGMSISGFVTLLLTVAACNKDVKQDAREMTGGDPERGAIVMRAYGCVACHTVPGVPGFEASVGPSLQGVADRVYIAGVVENTPANMIRWIRFPRQIDSKSAMPSMSVSERDARDIATYLYTLQDE